MQKQKTYIIFSIIALTLTALSANTYAQPSSEQIVSAKEDFVHMPDPNLRHVVADTLQVDPASITQADMLRLDLLDARSRSITKLDGLEYAVNLEHLELARNPISSVEPLAGLRKLRRLFVWECQLADISPLSQLDALIYLDISENEVSNIQPLANLTNLLELGLHVNNIADISPLSQLDALIYLDISENEVSNIQPLANLTNLLKLRLHYNNIIDVSPLSQLDALIYLDISHNEVSNIQPLANLTNLLKLRLHYNNIIDVSPLKHLINLEWLNIRYNPVTDVTSLDSLTLTDFFYDETCDMPPLPLQPRLDNRTYPSIFAAWGGPGWIRTLNRPDLSDIENLASHDLWFGVPHFGLDFQQMTNHWAIRGNLDDAIRRRNEFHDINPNMIFLVQIRMVSYWDDQAPEDWPHWLRDNEGQRVKSTSPGAYRVNFTHPEVQDRIVEQGVAVAKCGLYDGIFFDRWYEDSEALEGYVSLEAEQRARDSILERIRDQVRPNFLIMGNTNVHPLPRTGFQINGSFMETPVPGNLTADEAVYWLGRAEESLRWLANNTRTPRINALEGHTIKSELPDSPANLRWMRAITTLGLTYSNGYVLFSKYPGHHHYWYDFWGTDLGRPVGEKQQLYQDIDGLYIREFTNGWAVHNHSGSEQTVTLPELTSGVASGVEGTEHTLPNLDGEIYLRVKPVNPADVNGDGVVNILDLVVVAQAFGKDGLQGDVNGDGVVNVFDLVFVAGAIGGGGAAPSAYSPELSIISAANVERWLALAQDLGVGDANFQRGIRFLEGLLAALTPEETTLLPNYPNPFNPETWIPYRLAREAEVAIAIYDTKGTLVRRLALGSQAAGYYSERGKAVYWDGQNEDGEAVASGIYIYQFRAGDYAASRRMVIVK